MDQAVSLAARSGRFESSFYPCKVNLNTRRGEALRPHTHQPSPLIPWQQIRAHRLGVQCLTDPDCRRAVTRDGNGYPKPETRWVFTPLGYGFGSIFIPMGLLMGIN